VALVAVVPPEPSEPEDVVVVSVVDCDSVVCELESVDVPSLPELVVWVSPLLVPALSLEPEPLPDVVEESPPPSELVRFGESF
jgi:hypothetical protein